MAHTWMQSGWLDTVPRVIPAGSTDLHALVVQAVNGLGASFGSVALVQVGIVYLAAYLVDRRRRPFFWFALQGTTAAIYPLWVLGSRRRCWARGTCPRWARSWRWRA